MARSSGGIAPPPAIRRMPKARLRDEPLIKLVQAATRSAWRGAQLTQQMLAFSRRQVLTAKATDLNAAVSGMSEMLRRTLGEHGVEVRTRSRTLAGSGTQDADRGRRSQPSTRRTRCRSVDAW